MGIALTIRRYTNAEFYLLTYFTPAIWGAFLVVTLLASYDEAAGLNIKTGEELSLTLKCASHITIHLLACLLSRSTHFSSRESVPHLCASICVCCLLCLHLTSSAYRPPTRCVHGRG